MEKPTVSIIIVNWNAKKYLEKCITSIQNQTYQNFEIILVDNSSTDGSVEFVENKFPNITIIKNEKNLGFAEGNNIGIKKARGEIIGLFNPDAIADENWLSNLVESLNSSEKIAAVTGKMYYLGDKYGKNAVFCTWSKMNSFSAMPVNFHDDEPQSKVDYLSGSAMLVKKSVIDKIGVIDPGYFLYFEETDWCARMIRAGYDLIYTPKAIVWHKVASSIQDSKKIYYMERSRIRFALKNFDVEYIVIFNIEFFFETLYVFLRDLKNMDFTRSKIRFKAIKWNWNNFGRTLKQRKNDLDFLKIKGKVHSYNKSLPLRKVKIQE